MSTLTTTDVVHAFEMALDGDPVTADDQLEQLHPQDPATEPDQVLWRAVVAALAGREDAARQMLAELHSRAPQFVEAARRFGTARLVPAEVLERVLPRRPRRAPSPPHDDRCTPEAAR